MRKIYKYPVYHGNNLTLPIDAKPVLVGRDAGEKLCVWIEAEVDDVHKKSISHPAAPIDSAALSIAQSINASGKVLLYCL